MYLNNRSVKRSVFHNMIITGEKNQDNDISAVSSVCSPLAYMNTVYKLVLLVLLILEYIYFTVQIL